MKRMIPLIVVIVAYVLFLLFLFAPGHHHHEVDGVGELVTTHLTDYPIGHAHS